jgi:toxin ParE1/3/4
MRLTLSSHVPTDLEEIADYIAQDSPRHAARFIRLLQSHMQEIARQPHLYQIRTGIAADARLATVGSYIILFRIRGNAVRIERVVHGNRDLLALVDDTE